MPRPQQCLLPNCGAIYAIKEQFLENEIIIFDVWVPVGQVLPDDVRRLGGVPHLPPLNKYK